MSPHVTVLLAVHDGEPWLRETVASVLAQTERDFELLVVDDASTDASVETVESFGDERVRILRNERNLGQVPSLNRGLREARGELVMRIDADDVCAPERLARQVAVLDAEPRVAVVGSWLELIDERGRRVGALRERLDGFVDFVFHTLIMRVYIAHPAALFRLGPVLELGGYDEATGPAEDKDLWRRLLLAGWDARIVPEPLVRYRLHGAQLSQTRAAYQRDVDGRSQDRFLAALASESTPAVRLALADYEELWATRHDSHELLRGVEAVLAGASRRFELGDAESARLELLTARRLLRVARRRPWRPEARALLRWSLDRIPQHERPRALSSQAASYALAPLRLGVRRSRRAFGDAPPLTRLHAARRLYARLVGGG